MVDLFDEVEEELRSDWYRKLFRRWAPWASAVLAAVVAAYLGYWGVRFYQDRNLAKVALAYQSGVDAATKNDNAGAVAQFQVAAQGGRSAYKCLALMQEAGLRQAAGKPEEAEKLFDAAAAAAPNQVFSDLANLRAAEAVLDTAPLPQLETRLVPLTKPDRPFSVYAKEALAMAELMAGKTADARRDLSLLMITLGITDDMRDRAQAAIQLIDSGEASTAVVASKAFAKSPPPAPSNAVAAPQQATGADDTQAPPAGALQ